MNFSFHAEVLHRDEKQQKEVWLGIQQQKIFRPASEIIIFFLKENYFSALQLIKKILIIAFLQINMVFCQPRYKGVVHNPLLFKFQVTVPRYLWKFVSFRKNFFLLKLPFHLLY